jgi:hypothetical protein
MHAETIEEEQHLKDVLSVYEFRSALKEFSDLLEDHCNNMSKPQPSWEAVKYLLEACLSSRGIVL